MKNNFASIKRFPATLLAALLLGAGAASARAVIAPPSPILTNAPAWDCLITGANGERGIVFITFTTNSDGFGNRSFYLQQIHTRVPASTPVTTPPIVVDPRGGSVSGRGDVNVGLTNLPAAVAASAGTNIYGHFTITNGSWGFDYKGNVLGFFVELVADKPAEGTNAATYLTNQVSFIAKLTPNKRLTLLYSSSLAGNGKYSGVPQKAVTNKITGTDFDDSAWTANEVMGSVSTVELFKLKATSLTNAYAITGVGPGYTLHWPPTTSLATNFGICLISSQKKIAFANLKFTTNAVGDTLRATYGPLINSTKVVGTKTKGLIQPGAKVNYDAYFVPF